MSDDQTPQKSNGPESVLRDGNLKANIWKRSGQNGDYFETSFAKTYQDKEGKLRDTQNFAAKDLLGISELAREAHHRSRELRREAFINKRSDRGNQHRDRSRD